MPDSQVLAVICLLFLSAFNGPHAYASERRHILSQIGSASELSKKTVDEIFAQPVVCDMGPGLGLPVRDTSIGEGFLQMSSTKMEEPEQYPRPQFNLLHFYWDQFLNLEKSLEVWHKSFTGDVQARFDRIVQAYLRYQFKPINLFATPKAKTLARQGLNN
jgi:hypothetical protein